jgi:hypothetical protein
MKIILFSLILGASFCHKTNIPVKNLPKISKSDAGGNV